VILEMAVLQVTPGRAAEFEAAFHLTFSLIELIGSDEALETMEEQSALLRLLTPVVKLTTAKQCVAVVSEALECFGGAGYVEDTGLPMLLRDSQVFSIWEGTTNVLALEALRAASSGAALAAFGKQLRELVQGATDAQIIEAARRAEQAFSSAVRWFDASSANPAVLEAGARDFALTLGRSLALALLARHAQWALQTERDELPLGASARFALHGVDRIGTYDLAASRALAME